ncbi:MAG: DAK2 domain-containing protein [Clostridia bacterium]|nr:DAK2 domain-containing protein [Clostridia bacterium]
MARKFLNGNLFAKMFRGGVAYLRAHVKAVNDMNVFPVPDGDTGDNMMMTMEGGAKALSRIDGESLDSVAKSLMDGMLLGARGNSGVILSQFFAGISKEFVGHEEVSVEDVGHALKKGIEQAYSSVSSPKEGTILTVARESVEYAVSRINDESTVESLFKDLVTEMDASLKRTPEILAVLKEAGVVDSGGAGLKYIAEGFLKILNGEDLETLEAEAPQTTSSAVADIDFSKFGPDSVMDYGYCTELLVQLMNAKTDPQTFDVEELKAFLATIGDSIVAYKTGTIVKLHVHTMQPYKVLEYCHQFGEFLTLKIENMSVQHNETVEKPKEKPHKRYGVVAVANGDGIRDLYTKLGADEIVSGGQTMNPSAQNFLEVFEDLNVDHIIVFPNNSNIILAARQAAKIYENAQVHVIESKNVGDCYAALSTLDLENENVDEIIEEINASMSEVETGFVTYAVRNTEMNGVKVREGDYISFCDKQMMASEPEILDSAMKLLEGMNASECDIVNIFYGKSVTEELLDEYVSKIEEAYPDIEVQTLDGGQDVYRFIVVTE